MRVGFGFILPFLFVPNALAAFSDAIEIKTMCQQDNPILTGYIAGWLDKSDKDFEELQLGTIGVREAKTRDMLDEFANRARANICISPGVSLGAIQDVVCRKIEVDKFLADWPAQSVIRAALVEAWPCESKSD
ncbi:Rap1a/Tai family immunity protein [Sinorhizobium meliloti]|uniref:Rap1a/Tai family immunity protein n=1 Tax=Rhizobium meliloti TaxID=382 RepID=UPI003704A5D3